MVGMSVLITGCGRSGTLYIARCLQLAGLDVQHERLGADGAVSSVWNAPQPPYPSWHQQGERPAFDIILHQVREPLATMGSVMTGGREGWKFNARWAPIDLSWHPVKRAAYYWYWWNRRAEEQGCYTYRIENLEAEWDVLMALIGHEAEYTGDDVSKSTNSRRHDALSWEDVKQQAPEMLRKIAGMAQRYGYEIA